MSVIETYQNILQAWYLRRAAENPGMYDEELREWEVAHPCPLFKDFLLHQDQERIAA